MADEIGEGKPPTKADQWRERIAERERSGLSVEEFCKQRELSERSFYSWCKRLRDAGPVRFALVERGAAQRTAVIDGYLELVLVSGERLRISSGVDGTTLRTVLEALRG